jgi:hypothetical protein
MKRKLLFLLIVISLIISVIGCADKGTGTAVAILNGEEISRESFDKLFEGMKNMYSQQGVNFEGEGSEELLSDLKQYVLDTLINERVLLQEAEKKGFEVSSEEINSELEQIRSRFGSDEEFEKALSDNFLDLEQLKENIATEIKIGLYLDSEVEAPVVTEEEVEELYNQYSEMFDEMPEFDIVRDDLEAELREDKKDSAVRAFLKILVEKSEIEILI